MCSTVQEQITTRGQNAFVKIGERTNIRPQKQNKKSVFLGCVLIIVGKHAETESLIKMHFKRKHFSEICSEQILTRMKIHLHKMGHGVKL